MLQINSAPIGQGRERACYVHPEDPTRAIKIPTGEISKQTRREIAFYERLQRRGFPDGAPLPRYYGQCDTNLGRGIVVDLIRDYDGQISRQLNALLADGIPIEEFESYLIELKQALLEHLIIFNHDLTIGALLFQRRSFSEGRLVVIDGLGDTVVVDWPNRFPWLVRRKIERRWERFIERMYRTREIREQRAAVEEPADDRKLD